MTTSPASLPTTSIAALALIFTVATGFLSPVAREQEVRVVAAGVVDAFSLSSLNSRPPSSSSSFSSCRGRFSSTGRCSSYRNQNIPVGSITSSSLRLANKDDEDEDEEEDLLSGDDWRAFRAKLVMSESSSDGEGNPGEGAVTTTADPSGIIVDDSDLDGIGAIFGDDFASQFTPLDPSQWAYDSGKVIEKGAVILGGVDQDFGFGLRQQYFHKAVILVLEHDERKFTKGIILNRPSDQMLADDINDGDLKWKVWFGGDVQGLDSIMPDIVCLHSLKGVEARNASVPVMKDIQWTTFENAKKLVKKGVASGPEDFWLFAGYAGWGPQQLSGELDRKSWYMCATDSQTLLQELAEGGGVDPRDAGLDTWGLLMKMIGRSEKAEKSSGSFDDLCLKEWGRANLLTDHFGGDDLGTTKKPLIGSGEAGKASAAQSVDDAMKEAKDEVTSESVTQGAILRGSSLERSPFLLKKQEFHKSLVLVIHDDVQATVGTILSHPATKVQEIEGKGVPVRYGGDYAVKGQGPMMWLHCNERMRNAGVGNQIGSRKDGKVYQCSLEEVSKAVSLGLGSAEDFLLVSGVCVWPKIGGNSLAHEVKRGTFELVPSSRVDGVFDELRKQTPLTSENLSSNVEIMNEAWSKGATGKEEVRDVLTVGIGEGFDEEDDSVVFNSDVKVIDLADTALRKWVATFLLGDPTL